MSPRLVQMWDPQLGQWSAAVGGTAAGNTAPTARLTGPTSATTGTLLTYEAADSFDSDGGTGDPITYAFALTKPATSAAALTTVSTTSRRFTPDIDGTYSVEVTVTDDGGASRGVPNPVPLSSTATVTTSVTSGTDATNTAPTAKLTGPTTANTGTLCTYDASGSSDPDGTGDPLTFSWALTKPSTSAVSLVTVDADTRTLTPDVAGDYKVTVTVTDDGGAARGVLNPVPLSSTASRTLTATATSTTVLGRAGIRARIGWLVMANTTMVADFETYEAEVGRTIASGDPLRFMSTNVGHWDRVPPRNSEWDGEVTKFINQWGPRVRSSNPVRLCAIMSMYGDGVKNPTVTARRTFLDNIRSGTYDAAWIAGIDRLTAAGFRDYFVPRIGHESELTPGNHNAKFTHITSPGSLSHLQEMEKLWRDAVEHLMRLWTSRGYRVSYPGNGGWFAPVSQNNHLGSSVHSSYFNMPAWEFGAPDPALYYDFGCDIYVGGGSDTTFTKFQEKVELLQATARSLGKPFSMPEVGVWKAKNGNSQNFTATQVTAGLTDFYGFLETTPATGAGSVHYINYFWNGRAVDTDGVEKYRMTDLRTHWPASHTAIMVNRLGNA